MKLSSGFVGKIESQRNISKLWRENNTNVKSLSDALAGISQNKLFNEERIWIDKIESLRRELNESKEEIAVVDYGAGSPDLELSAEVMSRGRIVRTTVGVVCRAGSVTKKWGVILLKLVREFNPQICLELGTCLGISGAYQAAALKSLSRQGKLISIEGDFTLASLAEKNFEKLGLDNIAQKVARFQDVLGTILIEYKPNFVFIDGQHDRDAVLGFAEKMCNSLEAGSVLVFDDINWSEGMKSAWAKISQDERFVECVDLGKMGICVIAPSLQKERQIYKVRL